MISPAVPVTANEDHEALLASGDPQLARNKRLVYDFWREVFESGQVDLADKYLSEDYIQHNPLAPTGRAGFVEFLSRLRKPAPIEPRVKAPLVAILAERDLVMLAFARQYPDPNAPDRSYTSTWFDLFRIESDRIAEHWDPAMKRPAV